MRKSVFTAALLCAAVSTPALANNDSADPDDPCAMVICLAGKLNGSNPSECDPMYKRFISIKKKDKNGFLPGHTSKARNGKLNECPSADKGTIKEIISKFGRLKNW